MDLEAIKRVVFRQVCFIQELSGRRFPPTYDETIVPISQLEEFDSVNGAEAATRITEMTGCDLQVNPFVDGNRPLTIREVAVAIYKKLNKGK